MFSRTNILNDKKVDASITWLYQQAREKNLAASREWICNRHIWSLRLFYAFDFLDGTRIMKEEQYMEISTQDEYKLIEMRLCSPWVV
jgi:hypothetical protein